MAIATRTRRGSRQGRRELLGALLFISPWIIGFVAFQLYPLIRAFYYSFTDFDLLQPPNAIGHANYHTAFAADPQFWLALSNTAIYVGLAIPSGAVVTIGLALLLNAQVKGQPVFRML